MLARSRGLIAAGAIVTKPSEFRDRASQRSGGSAVALAMDTGGNAR
jgi:hypothetical protein